MIEKSAFTTALFQTLMAEYGCVLARGLFAMSDVLTLRTNAEATYRDYDRGLTEILAGRTPEGSPHITADSFATDVSAIARFRQFGSIPLTRCPQASSVVATTLSESPLRPALEQYFGTQVGLSLTASSVRLSERANLMRRVFHQDGNFLGGIATQTINCWIALDPCGVDAPAMEVYPHRVPELMKAGDTDAIVPWEISEQTVYARLGKENFWTPEFAPGDAFIFDHMHVHRTHLTSTMTRDRFAMENWMFPISEPYRDQVLAWLG